MCPPLIFLALPCTAFLRTESWISSKIKLLAAIPTNLLQRNQLVFLHCLCPGTVPLIPSSKPQICWNPWRPVLYWSSYLKSFLTLTLFWNPTISVFTSPVALICCLVLYFVYSFYSCYNIPLFADNCIIIKIVPLAVYLVPYKYTRYFATSHCSDLNTFMESEQSCLSLRVISLVLKDNVFIPWGKQKEKEAEAQKAIISWHSCYNWEFLKLEGQVWCRTLGN